MTENLGPALDLDPKPRHGNFLSKGLKRLTGKNSKAAAVPSISSEPIVSNANSKAAYVSSNPKSDSVSDRFHAIGYESVSDSTEPTRVRVLPRQGPSVISVGSGSASLNAQMSANRPSMSSEEYSLKEVMNQLHGLHTSAQFLPTLHSNNSSEMHLPSPEIHGIYEPSANESVASFGSLDPKSPHLAAQNLNLMGHDVMEMEPRMKYTPHLAQEILSPPLKMSAMGAQFPKFPKIASAETLRFMGSGSPNEQISSPVFAPFEKDPASNNSVYSFEVVNSNVNMMPPTDVVDTLFKKLLSSRVFPHQSFQNISTKRKWELLLSETEANMDFDLPKLTSQLSVSLPQLRSMSSPIFMSQETRPSDLSTKVSSKLAKKVSIGRNFSGSFMSELSNPEPGTLGVLSKNSRMKEGSPTWFVSRIMANKLTIKEFRKLAKKLESKGSKNWLYEFQDAQGETALSVILQRINKRSIKSNDDIIREQHICHCLKMLLSTDRRKLVDNQTNPSDDEHTMASNSSFVKSDLLVINSIIHSLLSPSSTTRLSVTELLVYLIHCSRFDYFPYIMDGFTALQDAMGEFVRFLPWLNVFETAIDQHFNLTANQRNSNDQKFKNYVLTTLILINMIIQKGELVNDRAHTRKELSDSRLPIIFDKLGAMKDENINQQIQEYEDVENEDYSNVLNGDQFREFEEEQESHSLSDIYSRLKLGFENPLSLKTTGHQPTSANVSSIIKRLNRLEASKSPKEAQKVFILLEAILDHTISDSGVTFDPDSVLCMSVERLMDRMATDEMARRAVMETVTLRKPAESLKSAQQIPTGQVNSGYDSNFSAHAKIAQDIIEQQRFEIQTLRREKEKLKRVLRLKTTGMASASNSMRSHLIVDEVELRSFRSQFNRNEMFGLGASISSNEYKTVGLRNENIRGSRLITLPFKLILKNSEDVMKMLNTSLNKTLPGAKGGTFSGSTATVAESAANPRTNDKLAAGLRHVQESFPSDRTLPARSKSSTQQSNARMDDTVKKKSGNLPPPPPPPFPDFVNPCVDVASSENTGDTVSSAQGFVTTKSESVEAKLAAPLPSPPSPPLPSMLGATSLKSPPPPPPPPLPPMLAQNLPPPPPPPPLPPMSFLQASKVNNDNDLTSPPPPPPPPNMISSGVSDSSDQKAKGTKLQNSADIDASGNELIKSMLPESYVRPRAKLKQMHWKKIENIDNTFWSGIPNKEIFDELHLRGILKELERAFVAKNSAVKVKTKAPNVSTQMSQKVSILPRDLAQQFGINLHMFGNLSVKELMSKVLRCDESITENVSVLEFFNSDALSEIPDSVSRAFLPYSRDHSKPEQKLTKSPEDLERADRIFLEIFNMRYYWKSRSRALLVIHSFRKDSSDLLQKLDMIHRGASCILESENLKRVLALIRSVGNFMNDSSKQAMGFKIDILQRLKFMKDDSNSMTFLHYVEKIVRNNFPEYGCFVDELSILNHTQRIGIEQLEADCDEFKRSVMNVATSMTKGNLSDKDKFHPDDLILKTIKRSLEQAQQKVYLVETRKERSIALYCEVMDHYGENSLDSNSKNSFFAKFSNFVLEFKKVHAENVQKEEDERVYERKKQMIERKENALREQKNERNRQDKIREKKANESAEVGQLESKNARIDGGQDSDDDDDIDIDDDDDDDDDESETYATARFEKESKTPESIDELLRRLKYRSPMIRSHKLRRGRKGRSYNGLKSLYSFSIENLAHTEEDVGLRREKSSNEYESVKSLRRRLTTRKNVEQTKQNENSEQYDVVMLRAQAMLSRLRSKTNEKGARENALGEYSESDPEGSINLNGTVADKNSDPTKTQEGSDDSTETPQVAGEKMKTGAPG